MTDALMPCRRLLEARYRREAERLRQEHRATVLQGGPGAGKKLAMLICEQGDVERALKALGQRGGTDQE